MLETPELVDVHKFHKFHSIIAADCYVTCVVAVLFSNIIKVTRRSPSMQLGTINQSHGAGCPGAWQS
jgi:hypothetical protein